MQEKNEVNISENRTCWCGCGRNAEETKRQDSKEILILGIVAMLYGLMVAWYQ